MRKIKGWLILWAILFVYIVGSYAYGINYSDGIDFFTITGMAFLAFGIYVLYLFFTNKPNAFTIILIMLIANAVITLINGAYYRSFGFFSGMVIAAFFQGLLAFIWYLYMKATGKN